MVMLEEKLRLCAGDGVCCGLNLQGRMRVCKVHCSPTPCPSSCTLPSEYGIGGGKSDDGDRPANTAQEVATKPYS